MTMYVKVNWLYSFIINLSLFGLRNAVKFPILIGYKTKICLKKQAKIEIQKIEFGIVKIGISTGSLGIGRGMTTSLYMGEKSKIVFKGKTMICKKSYIDIEANSYVEFGANFSANSGYCLKCGKSIVFGDDCILGWNVTVIDKDGHDLSKEGRSIESVLPIIVGNHVWIGAEVMILKGAEVQDGVVVGAKSLLTSKKYQNRCLYAGVPAKLISKNIDWAY